MTPELLSPAGGIDAALAAFQYGADAVYIGLSRFSARADAENVTFEHLRSLLAYAHSFTPAKKVYITFNTLVQDAELAQALDQLDGLDDLAPDGVIVQDLGIARLIRDHFPHLALHASTQLAAHNLEGVLALKDLGFTRVVLARELTLDEVARIVRESGVEIEIFIHGALCYSYSGLCLFSSFTAARSGNRGRCAYCCRESFRPLAEESSAAPHSSYPFSMRDLALAPLIDAVVATGAHSLKIEGRLKNPLYVACVTDFYRRKLDRALAPEDEHAFIQDLQTVFSRPWTTLYAAGSDASAENVIDALAIGHRGAPIGRVDAVVRDREGTSWLRFTTARALEKHDGLQIELPDGGRPFGFPVILLRASGSLRTVVERPAGSTVEVALPTDDVPMIPPNAPVFCSASQAVRRRYTFQNLRESAFSSGHLADIRVTLSPDGIAVYAEAAFEKTGDVTAAVTVPLTLTPSRQPEQTAPAVRKAFERLGDTPWRLGAFTLDDAQSLYAPASKLNEARRAVFEKLTAAWDTRRAARRASIASQWKLNASVEGHPEPARWSLKLRADSPPLATAALAGIDTLVLAIGHMPCAACEKQLAAWEIGMAHNRIRLALPLITRDSEIPQLKETLRTLVQQGWKNWECADLAGYRMLGEQGIVPASADWSLYAFNRIAAAELTRLGIDSFVLSPENSLENILSLASSQAELLAYQHTPLFLSATAPCISPTEDDGVLHLSDRKRRTFVTRQLDGLWVTVGDTAFCVADRIADSGLSRFRIDLSWSPDVTSFSDIIRTVIAGQLPPGTHTSNFIRGIV